MKSFLIYCAGYATPFLISYAVLGLCDFKDWQARRRYDRVAASRKSP